jgi:hypothetical protein
MKTLRQALDDYLTLRQAMGFKLSEARTLLPQFVDFLDHQGATFITTEWALEWATQPRHIQPAGWASRLRSVRGFARYHSAIDPRTEIPPTALLPYRPQRRSPYLYSDAEIPSFFRLPAACLPPRGCAPTPTPRCSACWWSPACVSVNLWGWTITIVISTTAC